MAGLRNALKTAVGLDTASRVARQQAEVAKLNEEQRSLIDQESVLEAQRALATEEAAWEAATNTLDAHRRTMAFQANKLLRASDALAAIEKQLAAEQQAERVRVAEEAKAAVQRACDRFADAAAEVLRSKLILDAEIEGQAAAELARDGRAAGPFAPGLETTIAFRAFGRVRALLFTRKAPLVGIPLDMITTPRHIVEAVAAVRDGLGLSPCVESHAFPLAEQLELLLNDPAKYRARMAALEAAKAPGYIEGSNRKREQARKDALERRQRQGRGSEKLPEDWPWERLN